MIKAFNTNDASAVVLMEKSVPSAERFLTDCKVADKEKEIKAECRKDTSDGFKMIKWIALAILAVIGLFHAAKKKVIK